jgi:hypothetical protein
MMVMVTIANDNLNDRLGTGTQVVLLSELPDKLCRCGEPLQWYQHAKNDYAECDCGMVYMALAAVVTIEGTDRNMM